MEGNLFSKELASAKDKLRKPKFVESSKVWLKQSLTLWMGQIRVVISFVGTKATRHLTTGPSQLVLYYYEMTTRPPDNWSAQQLVPSI